jgi:hypothetical protein
MFKKESEEKVAVIEKRYLAEISRYKTELHFKDKEIERLKSKNIVNIITLFSKAYDYM